MNGMNASAVAERRKIDVSCKSEETEYVGYAPIPAISVPAIGTPSLSYICIENRGLQIVGPFVSGPAKRRVEKKDAETYKTAPKTFRRKDCAERAEEA